MVQTQDKQVEDFLKLFKKVQKSKLYTAKYFKTNKTIIGLRQYFRLKKRVQIHGPSILVDQRHNGNARKVKGEQEDVLRSVFTYNRHKISRDLQVELRDQWDMNLSIRRIDQYREKFNLPRIKQTVTIKKDAPLAGIEIFTAIAHHIGILENWTKTIQRRLEVVKQSDRYSSVADNQISKHLKKGKFTSKYNRSAQVRKMKFASITDKVKNKDFSRLSLYQRETKNISRKNLAVLLLPLVTNNGVVRSLDKPMGNALEYACGWNYKNATIDKYLRELKYLQVSNEMIHCNATFWTRFWKKYNSTEQQIGCYYIDGTVRPLWSSKRCRKGKVTMLGRVMGCLEQVVLHDGYGHPIYFQTFSGHADLQKYALESMETLNNILGKDLPRRHTKKSHCSRALIIDGAGNAVKTLRAFSESKSKYYHITILDTNQIKERKFKHLLNPQRYHYGKATLIDCQVELIDSNDPKYIYESRAIRVKWDNEKECCLVTDIPQNIFNASEVVKGYFDRWPYAERQYAMMKAAVCFYQIVGYGKKEQDDENMLTRIKQLEKDLRQLNSKLAVPLSQINEKEKKLEVLYDEERLQKEKSKVLKGKRRHTNRNEKDLSASQKLIRKITREIKEIEKPFKEQFAILKKKSKEFSRIQGKRKVYHVDVELDQLLTSFRLTLANILAYIAKEILDDNPIEMSTLIQSILYLPGRIEEFSKCRMIFIYKNKKDPEFMAVLEKGLAKINELNICHPAGKLYKFGLV